MCYNRLGRPNADSIGTWGGPSRLFIDASSFRLRRLGICRFVMRFGLCHSVPVCSYRLYVFCQILHHSDLKEIHVLDGAGSIRNIGLRVRHVLSLLF